ncbi:MFS transporter [Aspergillus arachidicola]|uniref:MFS transporter n=1 Tax=Aspergillus arachidicola TaxID=656916 RepID=A0A2G7FUE0_9EURO|nr:MFS transporter [Aspergillus arachidicola]
MQAYLQYRSIRNAVRRQLDDLPDRARASLHDGMFRPEVTDGLDPSSSQTSSSLHPPRQKPVSHGFSSPLLGVELLDKSDDHGNHCEVFLVGWDHDEDPMNPRNFTTRVMATLIVSALAFVVSAASSIESAVLRQNSAAYNVSEVVASLATGIFLLGFAAGSLVSGPLLGDSWPKYCLYWLYVSLTFRFLAGVFGCPPLTCAGGAVADLWDPLEKTLIFPLYAILSFGGAVLSPVIASYMGQGTLSWRWTNWIVLIMAGLVLGLVVLSQPETYSPLLLKWKARHLRQLTGDPRYQSKLDLDRTSLLSRIVTACGRQFTLAMYEPIILLLALYMTILYIVLFTFFDGYTHIFSDVHDLSQGLTNIIWVAMYVGIMLAGLIVPGMYSSMKNALKEIQSRDDNGNDNGASSNRQSPPTKSPSLNPKNRLWYTMISAPAIPISLFWMGWTDYKNISVWSPIVGSSLFGFGSICMFISSYMYVIDAYEIYAASALGFMTVTRYCAAGGMTVAGVPFYNNVGVEWTLTILGIISAVMVPVPYIFWKFEKVIRGWSRYAV